jgi:phage shock protein C
MGETAGGVLRRGPDRVVAGVCSGLGHYFGVDPLIVRLVFVLMTVLHGVGILIYAVLWFLMEPPVAAQDAGSRTLGQRVRMMGDEIRDDFRSGFSRSSTSVPGAPTPGESRGATAVAPPQQSRQRGVWIGAILIALGAYFLLDNLGVFNSFRWDLFWPVIFIAAGVLFLLRRR